MPRLVKWTLAAAVLAASTPADACAPEIIDFNPGSYRVGRDDIRTIDYEVERWRNVRAWQIILSTGSDRLAQKRLNAIRAALMRRGVPARAIVMDKGRGNSREVWVDVIEPQKPEASCG